MSNDTLGSFAPPPLSRTVWPIWVAAGAVTLLVFLCGGILSRRLHPRMARRGEKAIMEPGLIYPHLTAVGAAVTAGDHVLAVTRIEEMGWRLDIDLDGLHEAISAYHGAESFLASEPYRKRQETVTMPMH